MSNGHSYSPRNRVSSFHIHHPKSELHLEVAGEVTCPGCHLKGVQLQQLSSCGRPSSAVVLSEICCGWEEAESQPGRCCFIANPGMRGFFWDGAGGIKVVQVATTPSNASFFSTVLGNKESGGLAPVVAADGL